jgi:monofunctional biosynthetic peptidoglycan transglycosylase
MSSIAVGFALVAYAYLTLPDVRPLARVNPSTTAFMELRAEEARLEGRQPRVVQHWIAYDRISPHVKRAVLLAEDDAFWQHEGVDFEQLQESLEVDWARGGFVRGASTITQQLAKNLYLSPSKNPLRKFRELVIARRLEAELKKARILELYLNVIEWGDGIYGVDAAARTYFGTSAAAVSPEQAALLAGAIINPRVLSPAKPTNRLLRRQQLILHRMGAVTPPPSDPKQGAQNPIAGSAVEINPEAPANDQTSDDSSPEDQSSEPLSR